MDNLYKVIVLIITLAANNVASSEYREENQINKIESAPYVTIGEHEYHIEPTERVNVTTAMTRCSERGMRLVSLETPTKNSEIRTYLTTNGLAGNLYWTEGFYNQPPALWQWTTLQQEFSFYDWYQLEGQPDEDPQVNDLCLMFGGRSGWWDEPCDNPWRFICE